MSELALLRCSIGPSPFSGERVFRFSLLDGTNYSGVAPVGYFRGSGHNRQLLSGEPEVGSRILGYIEVWRVAHDEDQATVMLPDNTTVTVPAGLIHFKEAGRTVRYEPT